MNCTYWTDIQLPKVAITPEMIATHGIAIKRNCYLSSEASNTPTTCAVERYVKYDKAYVKYRIAELLSVILFRSHDEISDHELTQELLASVIADFAKIAKRTSTPNTALKTYKLQLALNHEELPNSLP